MTEHERRKSRVLELVEQYYDTPQRAADKQGRNPGPTPPDSWTRKNLDELKILKKQLGKEISKLEVAKSECLFEKFDLLVHRWNPEAFVDGRLEKEVSQLEQSWIKGLESKARMIPVEAQSKRHELAALAHLESLTELPSRVNQLVRLGQLEIAIQLIRGTLLHFPSELLKYNLVFGVVEDLHAICHCIVELCIEAITETFSVPLLRTQIQLIKEVVECCEGDSELARKTVKRILDIREGKIRSTLQACNIADLWTALDVQRLMVKETSEELSWVFPEYHRLVKQSDYEITTRVFPTQCICYVIGIEDFGNNLPRFQSVFSDTSEPKLSDAIGLAFRASVRPLIQRLIQDFPNHRDDLFRDMGTICAEYLTIDPRECVVTIFQSSVIKAVIESTERVDDWYLLLSLHSRLQWFEKEVCVKLLRMVASEMIDDSVSLEMSDSRLFLSGITIWVSRVESLIAKGKIDQSEQLIEGIDPWRSELYALLHTDTVPTELRSKIKLIDERLPAIKPTSTNS